MRIVWGLYDSETETLECLFEAENLLTNYRDDVLLKRWYDNMTKPVVRPEFYGVGEETLKFLDDEADALRESLLDVGYDRWRNDQIHPPTGALPRYITQKYELWNSVPPNPERLIVHFDT